MFFRIFEVAMILLLTIIIFEKWLRKKFGALKLWSHERLKLWICTIYLVPQTLIQIRLTEQIDRVSYNFDFLAAILIPRPNFEKVWQTFRVFFVLIYASIVHLCLLRGKFLRLTKTNIQNMMVLDKNDGKGMYFLPFKKLSGHNG